MTSQGGKGIASIIISFSALAVSIASVTVTWIQASAAQEQVAAAREQVTAAREQVDAARKQVAVAEAEIDELRRQFEEAGPKIRLSTALQYKSATENFVSSEQESLIVNKELVNSYPDIYLLVKISNTGRSATSIESVQMQIASDFWISAELSAPNNPGPKSVVYCGEKPFSALSSCIELFPLELNPGNAYTILFPINIWYNNLIESNYGSDGLQISVQAVGVPQQSLTYRSKVRVVP